VYVSDPETSTVTRQDLSLYICLENVTDLGMMLTNQSYIQKEMKRKLNLGNECCRSVQNRLSSRRRSMNTKFVTLKKITLLVVQE
jgi:hypothetical protein